MTQWTCLDCGTEYTGTFSDNCPECKSGRAIINAMTTLERHTDFESKMATEWHESGIDLSQKMSNECPINVQLLSQDIPASVEATKLNPEPEVVTPVVSALESPETVSELYRPNHTRHAGRGRPRIYLTSNQLNLADDPEKQLSLRARASILGVSPATVLRMDRRKAAEKVK